MDVHQAWEIIKQNSYQNFGNYYAPLSEDKPAGVGQIYTDVRYPVFNLEDRLYDTFIGYVYVLTHECDISQENPRPFNKNALIAPIMPFESWIDSINTEMSETNIHQFLANLVKENISRVKYLPHINETHLPYGGIIDLNKISNTHISELTTPLVSLTNYSLQILDIQLTNHLLRPKANISLIPAHDLF